MQCLMISRFLNSPSGVKYVFSMRVIYQYIDRIAYFAESLNCCEVLTQCIIKPERYEDKIAIKLDMSGKKSKINHNKKEDKCLWCIILIWGHSPSASNLVVMQELNFKILKRNIFVRMYNAYIKSRKKRQYLKCFQIIEAFELSYF